MHSLGTFHHTEQNGAPVSHFIPNRHGDRQTEGWMVRDQGRALYEVPEIRGGKDNK